MNQLTDAEFKALRDYIEKSCGITLGDEKAYLVESRLVGLLTETNCASFGGLLRKAINEPQLGLRDKIVEAMTTNETSWFRDQYPFEILQNVILKQWTEEITAGSRNKIRIWCAACSTGQEPYSIAMVLQEFSRKVSPLPLQYSEILGTDISSSVLFFAVAGRYDQISMSRGMPHDMRDRYFSNSGMLWKLNDKIRRMVVFKRMNLQDDFSPLGRFDVIFCRNVLIYFSDAFKRQLLSRFAEILNPAGYFFVGASESMNVYTNRFVMINQNRHLYYQVNKEVRT